MSTHLRKKDRKVLGEYLRSTADAMELRDWTLELLHEPTQNADHGANVDAIYGRKLAYVSFHQSFRDKPPEEQRHIVVHELVHLHLESALDSVRRDLDQVIGKPADAVLWNGFKRQMEYGIDGLATAIAKHLPLIHWP